MPAKFSPTPLFKLFQIVQNQYKNNSGIFGIPKELFFTSHPDDPFRMIKFGKVIENPIGVAAGPHTQLAQNIVSAWLCGARFIELKTIQTLDNLDISKPCIDMGDEGYNCEWSQELKIRQSFDQYLDAWILIHILKHMLGGHTYTEPGFIFNMSIGYDFEGIQKQNVQHFLDNMRNAEDIILERIEPLKHLYPALSEITINPCVSDNVTLSTMHGCPPDEIDKIASFLIEKKKLNTILKLNPTLLGKEVVKECIVKSGYEIEIPDSVFENDLEYRDAVPIIERLKIRAEKNNVFFGIKVCNTLPCLNTKNIFPENEKLMYMSGAPLHSIAVKLACMIQHDFNEKLDISFSGGLDAYNVSDIVSCGLLPATVCSDILKPGGYGRLSQYIENLRSSFAAVNAKSLDEFINLTAISFKKSTGSAVLHNLVQYISKLENSKDYSRKYLKDKSIKTHIPLGTFDCIHAPCETACSTNQNIPGYMYYASNHDFERAKKIILDTNPFPTVTGKVCNHFCQDKCTRMHYDNPLRIRDVKYAIAENSNRLIRDYKPVKISIQKVSVIGAGPSGLTCAYYLKLAGINVEVYESKDFSGGMLSSAIPAFRLDNYALKKDLKQVLNDITIHYNQRIDYQQFDKILKESNFVYIATGVAKSRKLSIAGSELPGILDPIQFLTDAKLGKAAIPGREIIIIGGGNTAIDSARTAKRMVRDGKVYIVYRRTKKQMPANEEEIKEALNEGIEVLELVNPVKINDKNGIITGMTCQKMNLIDELDGTGRKITTPILDSDFVINCDAIIPALGQEPLFDFVNPEKLKTEPGTMETKIPHVFIGGDALNGGVSIIAAIGDGRKAAQQIIDRLDFNFKTKNENRRPNTAYRELMIKKSQRAKSMIQNHSSADGVNFNSLYKPLTKEEAALEASRCLFCDELCNICTIVCPNMALFAYHTKPTRVIDKNGDLIFALLQNTQILHIADWCNDCGNCTGFCPTSGSPYKNKPHLFMNKAAFNQAEDAYYFIYTNEEQTILHRKGSEIHSFAENPINYSYITKGFSAQLAKQSFEIQNIQYRIPGDRINLAKAVEMSILLEGAKQFFGV